MPLYLISRTDDPGWLYEGEYTAVIVRAASEQDALAMACDRKWCPLPESTGGWAGFREDGSNLRADEIPADGDPEVILADYC